MKLENMHLLIDWVNIQMGKAEVKSDIVKSLERTHANIKVMNYFNWTFDLILPWVNEFKPKEISDILIPNEIDGLIRMNNLKMRVD